MIDFILQYLTHEFETINNNLRDLTNPGYVYLLLCFLLKLWRFDKT